MTICPRCNTALASVEYQGDLMDVCRRCRGRWLTTEALGHIVDGWEPAARASASPEEAHLQIALAEVAEGLRCPACRGVMEVFNYGADSGIILDRCAACEAVWLDGDELDLVGRWAAASRQGLAWDEKRFSADLHREEVRQDALEQHDVRSSPSPSGSAAASPFLEGTEGP